MSINTNLNALRAARRLDEAGSARGRAFERLASGSRINRAGDDTAGLSVASSLNLESRVNSQAVRNVSDGVSFLNVADGAAKELKNILVRLRELAAQSSNGTFSNVQRASLDKEARALQAEYNRVLETARFNGLSVFGGRISVQAGAGTAAVLAVGVLPRETTDIGSDGTFAYALFAAGTFPFAVAAADLNGDGVLDIIAAGSAGPVNVLFGNGDGMFKARKSFAVGTVISLTADDADSDGAPDIITWDGVVSPTRSVLLGNGDGTFKAKQFLAFGGPMFGATSMAFADLNGDEMPDFVMTEPGANSLGVYLTNLAATTTLSAGLASLSEISVAMQSVALAAQGTIDAHLVSGAVGAGLSRLAVASAHLQAIVEATRAAEARITDVDAAEESARLVASTILRQAAAAAAALAHANQEPALALKLLSP